jgi:uncharacterized protein
MIVDLANLENSFLTFDFTVDPDKIDLESETENLQSSARVTGVLKKGIVQTDVSGTISTRVKVECTRCLEKIEQELEFPFEAAFVFPENFTEAREAELKDADLDVSVLETTELDLNELAREQILLNLPERVQCSVDCKGLCEKCGANRNLIDCNCEEKEIDPRWSALKDLK